MTVAFLAVAAAVGGSLRFVVEYKLPAVGPQAFPRATLIVNVVGSFILGIVFVVGGDIKTIVGIGLCGALTTFSGVSLQLHRRIVAGSWGPAITYFLATLLGCYFAAWLGMQLGNVIS